LAPKDVVVGLDVGTTKVCAIVALVSENGQIEIVGIGTNPSNGLKKGVVVNIEETVQSISKAVESAEQMSGIEIKSAYVGIAGGHITSLNNRGVVAVAGEDKEITYEDVQRVIQAAKVVMIPAERKLIHAIPCEYVVDGYGGIRNPVGMSGSRLEVETHIVTGAAAAVQNIMKSVYQAGVEIDGLVLEQIASGAAVLTKDEIELGVILIDVGGGTTDIAVFENGSIKGSAVLPLGGDHVTNDIAVGLRTPVAQAEKIKIKYGCALQELADAAKQIELPDVGGSGSHLVSQVSLANIIEPRMQELFALASREVKKLGCTNLLPGGVVITGGSSLLPGVLEIAEAEFNLSVRIGYPVNAEGLIDIIRSPIYATAVGLVLYGAKEQHVKDGILVERKANNIFAKFKKWLSEFMG